MAERPSAITASYNGVSPEIRGPLAFAGTGAAILGRTTLGTRAWLGHFAAIRADGHYIEIGDDFVLGDHGTIHIAHDVYPTHIGHRVSAGQGAVIHACTVGDDCVIDREAIILDGSIIGAGAVIAAGSVVFPRTELDGGWLYAGSPAKPIAPVSAAELRAHHSRIRDSLSNRPQDTAGPPSKTSLDCFVAPSARVTGDIRAEEGVGIWYGCRLDAGAHHIEIGAGTNIQDNSSVTCERSEVVIGPDVTVGHNVTMTDCRIDSGSLIGIGSRISAGTIVESDVLVAAGAHTEPGQRLTSGSIWAGRPARPIRPMETKQRKMMMGTLPVYRAYAEQFRNLPHRQLDRVGED